MKKRHMTMGSLAEELGTSRQNLSNKFSRDNLSEKEIAEIAAILDCGAEVVFTDLLDGQKF